MPERLQNIVVKNDDIIFIFAHFVSSNFPANFPKSFYGNFMHFLCWYARFRRAEFPFFNKFKKIILKLFVIWSFTRPRDVAMICDFLRNDL